MNYTARFLSCAAAAVSIYLTGTVQASGETHTWCAPNQKTTKSSSSRTGKLMKKHSNEMRALKEIHNIQKEFLAKFNGKTSTVSKAERDSLKLQLEALPSAVKSNDMPYFDQMEYIEYTEYAILSGKIKYSSKKAMKSPEKLLEDIQKKQIQYLKQRQKREIKKYIK